jgi:hypothetical protein
MGARRGLFRRKRGEKRVVLRQNGSTNEGSEEQNSSPGPSPNAVRIWGWQFDVKKSKKQGEAVNGNPSTNDN